MHRLTCVACAMIAGMAVCASTAGHAAGGSYSVLYDFQYVDQGGYAPGPVTVGPDGSIYGVAQSGGSAGRGEIFSLDAAGKMDVVHAFSGTDYGNPAGAPILRDDTLFGTAGPVIYSVRTDGSKYHVLHQPGARALVADKHTILYGINGRSLFELKQDGTYSVLQNFSAGSGGAADSLAIDRNENLFGTYIFTDASGTFRCDVFEYPAGGSAATMIHRFDGTANAACQVGGVDDVGVVYGYTVQQTSPKHESGTLFSLTPAADGYTYAVVHPFVYQQNIPVSLTVSLHGELAGTTIPYFGRHFISSRGKLFRVTHGHYNVAYVFENDNNGSFPRSAPVITPAGEIVGSTATGGSTASVKGTCNGRHSIYAGCGVVYAYKPAADTR